MTGNSARTAFARLSRHEQLALLRREKARRSLARFARGAWPIVEPGVELVWNWHLDAVCEHLEAVADGRIQRLLITMPPGHMKSRLCAVFFPAWLWLTRPEWRVLVGSYKLELAHRDSVYCRDIIRSEWYQSLIASPDGQPEWSLKGDQNVKGKFSNSCHGFRQTMSTGGARGDRGNGWIVDDPLGGDEGYSKLHRDRAWRWISKTLPTRLNDLRTGFRIIVGQRLHEEDPFGRILDAGGWEHLNIPAEFDSSARTSTSIGWSDPRSEDGELLFPERFPREALERIKSVGELGPREYAAQYQQKPSPDEGNIIKRAWFRHFDDLNPPKKFDILIISCDYNSGGQSEAASFTVLQLWGKVGADLYLLDQERVKWTAPEQYKGFENFCEKSPLHRAAKRKLVENAVDGREIIRVFARRIAGIIPIRPEGSKETRLRAVSYAFESGNVHLPRHAQWRADYEEELAVFPFGKHDDQADATSQALSYLLTIKRGRIGLIG